MDTNALVNAQLDGGSRLITALNDAGVEITSAFWAKLTEAPDWNLYVASPAVETDNGSLEAYRKLTSILSQREEIGVDIDDVLIIDVEDAMAVEAAEVVKEKVVNGKPYTGVTRFRGPVFGGLEIDGAYIYPPPRTVVTA